MQWTPIIGPGNMVFYRGPMFKAWEGSALVGGMASKSLTRVTFDGKGGAKVAERWHLLPAAAAGARRLRPLRPAVVAICQGSAPAMWRWLLMAQSGFRMAVSITAPKALSIA